MIRVLPLIAIPTVLALSSGSASALTLVGSELRYRGEVQRTLASELFVRTFPASAIVSESAVEFPSAASLFDPTSPDVPGFGATVNVSMDAGADFIEINYDNAGFGLYARGVQNTGIFTFTAPIALQITEAVVDPSTTFNGFFSDPERVTFDGNELAINYQSLPYNPNSFIRINLETAAAEPDLVSVPEPSTTFLLAGLAVVGAAGGLRRAVQA